MTTILKTIFSVLFFAAMTVQLSAQCGNTGIPSPTNDGNGGYIANSFIANCSGTNFTQLNLYRSGRDVSGFGQTNDVSEHQGTITIYQGESVDVANEIYSQAATFPAIPNDDGHHLMEIPLVGGTGSTAFTQGQVYTFRFSVPSNSYRWSITSQSDPNNYTDGRIYYGSQWWDHADLVFEMLTDVSTGGGSGSGSTCTISHEVGDNNGNYWSWAQSVTMDGSCTDGDFSSFEFNRFTLNGEQATTGQAITGTIKVLNGQSIANADVIYEQTWSLPATTAILPDTEWQAIQLGGGTGSLSYTAGNQYTFLLTCNETTPRFKVDVPAGYAGGSMYGNGTWQYDMRFRVNSGDGATAAAVPTMGEWALIILALIIMSMGVVTVIKWQSVQNLQTAGGNAQLSINTGGSSLPFNKKSYFQILPFVWGSLVAVFAVSMAFFGYEMTSADVPGALMAGAVGAYLIHLIRK